MARSKLKAFLRRHKKLLEEQAKKLDDAKELKKKLDELPPELRPMRTGFAALLSVKLIGRSTYEPSEAELERERELAALDEAELERGDFDDDDDYEPSFHEYDDDDTCAFDTAQLDAGTLAELERVKALLCTTWAAIPSRRKRSRSASTLAVHCEQCSHCRSWRIEAP
jgi:hypothetical protein